MDITYTIMLPVLEFLAKALGSYGWAIIGLTLAVRILVWPLVAASTKSMQKMSQLQPKLKEMQNRYKDQPEVFQKKMAEFYMKNKVNPLGGCLPMLVQLPILFALFGTFTGPPFQEKAIPVKVKILAPESANKATVSRNATSGGDSPYVSKDGKLCKFVVHPGDSTLLLGQSADGQATKDGYNDIDFTVSAAQGEAPADFKPVWRIGSDPNRATMSPSGQAKFPADGQIQIAAVVTKNANGDSETIPVTVKVMPAKEGEGGAPILGLGGPGEEATKEKKELSTTSAQVDVGGKTVEVAVEPGDLTLVAGKEIQFKLKAKAGELPEGLKVDWKILSDPNASTIDENGKAVFRHSGEILVDAVIPGEAKNDSFLFINNIGKVAKGMDLFQPANWDVLVMIILFGVTMYLSQKLMVTAPPADPDQAAIQKQTQQMMPLTVTGMFFFIPLPAGVYLYMVFSNVVQSLQTWLLMKSPAPDLVDVTEDAANATVTVVPKGKENGSGDNTVKITDAKKKQGKKK
ncbi:MAG: membrane protein insertase YidC [Candidatus Obscuribacterales bacterium]|nr:membrane protein insertase YidC [Candidatus Obscuribacterales bacterium]